MEPSVFHHVKVFTIHLSTGARGEKKSSSWSLEPDCGAECGSPCHPTPHPAPNLLVRPSVHMFFQIANNGDFQDEDGFDWLRGPSDSFSNSKSWMRSERGPGVNTTPPPPQSTAWQSIHRPGGRSRLRAPVSPRPALLNPQQ